MDLWKKFWQIMAVHNRPWSALEMAYFTGIEIILAVWCLMKLRQHKIQWFQALGILLLWPYLAAVLQSCVFTRSYTEPGIEARLFWSWKIAMEGNVTFIEQTVLNILLFVPIGILLPFIYGRPVPLWVSILAGFAFSFVIEFLQYVLARGLSEADDLLNNTLGCLFGTLIVNCIWISVRFLFRRLSAK